MIRLAKAQNITSMADFVAARHGKAASVAATVTVIATVAYVPYIALQIKATAAFLTIFFEGQVPSTTGSGGGAIILTLVVLLAGFSIAVGTRRLDARAARIRARAEAQDVRVLYRPLQAAALRSLLAQWLLVKAAKD